MILLTLSADASAQVPQSSGATVTIDRETADAAEAAFEEVKVSRPLIRDLRAENATLNTSLTLALKLAESESKRADAERGRAEAEAKNADSLQKALDASQGELAAEKKITALREGEAKEVRGQLKKEKRGRFLERVLWIGSHAVRVLLPF